MKLVCKHAEILLSRDWITNEVKPPVLGNRHREHSELCDALSGAPVLPLALLQFFVVGIVHSPFTTQVKYWKTPYSHFFHTSLLMDPCGSQLLGSSEFSSE